MISVTPLFLMLLFANELSQNGPPSPVENEPSSPIICTPTLAANLLPPKISKIPWVAPQ